MNRNEAERELAQVVEDSKEQAALPRPERAARDGEIASVCAELAAARRLLSCC